MVNAIAYFRTDRVFVWKNPLRKLKVDYKKYSILMINNSDHK